MQLKRAIILLTVFIMLLGVCNAGFLIYYVHEHAGPVPPRIILSMVCFLGVGAAAGIVATSRHSRKQARTETPEEARSRRSFAIKGLKVGLVVWTLILLNDVRMLVQHDAPWIDAIPGMAIVALLVIISWISLKRLRTAEKNAAQSGREP
jgi:membrane protein YdbS with pleckstrin-like domain